MRQSYAQRWVPRGTGSRAQATTAQVQVLGSRGLTAASAASQSGSDAGAATSSVLGRAAQMRARGPACRRHRRPALGHREAGHSLLAVLHLFLSVMSPPSHASSCSRLACSSESAGRLEPLGRRARPSARRGQPPRPCHPWALDPAPWGQSAQTGAVGPQASSPDLGRRRVRASPPPAVPAARRPTVVTCAKCLA